MKKKWINIALACGTAVLFATGCATNKRQKPQGNDRDLLRNRELVPPPFSSPDAVKGFTPAPSSPAFPGPSPAPQRASGPIHPGSVAIAPEGPQPALPSTDQFIPAQDVNEPIKPITSMFNENGNAQPRLVAVSTPGQNLSSGGTITRPVRPHTMTIPPPVKPANTVKPAVPSSKPTAIPSSKPTTTIPSKPASGTPPKAVAGQQAHTVVAGDTLSDIGYQYGVSWKSIAEVNGISENAPLRVGQKLVLPANALATPRPKQVKNHGAQGSKTTTGTAATAPAATTAKEGTHTVKAGDSLWTIAKAHHIKFNDIQAWNPTLVNKPLKIGQLVNIKDPKGDAASKPAASNETPKKADEKPAAGTAPTAPVPLPPVPPTPSKKEASGTVIGGINNATVINLTPAQEKKDTPAKAEETLLNHTVQAEDDLEKIALMYGANSPAEIADKIKGIKAKNPTIQSDKDLKPGTVIRVPYTPVVP